MTYFERGSPFRAGIQVAFLFQNCLDKLQVHQTGLGARVQLRVACSYRDLGGRQLQRLTLVLQPRVHLLRAPPSGSRSGARLGPRMQVHVQRRGLTSSDSRS
eukprot:SAG31_NODE_2657_length_5286_cov_7.817235_4_plen_102_part_00